MAAQALPKLSVGGAAELTSTTFERVAGADAWKYAMFDDTPIMNSAFDWVRGMGGMLWEGLFGAIEEEDDPAAKATNKLHQDSDTGAAAINEKLDVQTGIMQENLDATYDILTEAQGSRFEEIENERERRRRERLAGIAGGTTAPRLTAPAALTGGGPGLFTLLGLSGLLYGILSTGVRGFIQGLRPWASLYKFTQGTARAKFVKDISDRISKFTLFMSRDAFNKHYRDLEKALNHNIRTARIGKTPVGGQLNLLEQPIAKIAKLQAEFIKQQRWGEWANRIRKIYFATFGLPGTIWNWMRQAEKVVLDSQRIVDNARQAYRTVIDKIVGVQRGVNKTIIGGFLEGKTPNKETESAIRNLRKLGEWIRRIPSLITSPLTTITRFIRTWVIGPLIRLSEKVGKWAGRLLFPIFMALESWDEFKKSGSIFNAIMAATKEFFQLYIGYITDFLFVVLPGWLVEKISGLFGLDEFAAKVRNWRKEFHLGEWAWEGLMLLASTIWNVIAGLINSAIEGINAHIPFIDPISWRASFMDSMTGHIYDSTGKAFDTADAALSSRFGKNFLGFMGSGGEVRSLSAKDQLRLDAAIASGAYNPGMSRLPPATAPTALLDTGVRAPVVIVQQNMVDRGGNGERNGSVVVPASNSGARDGQRGGRGTRTSMLSK
jgi:hypothetical protein